MNIDQTKPTISAARDRSPNANDWYDADVTVSFTCADALSGIKHRARLRTRLGEGAAQSATGTAIDVAGNSDSVTESGINVDKTAPTISGAPTTAPNGNGWYQGDVTVHWTCSDALSGIDGACPADSVITSEGDNLSASASVSDQAGNTVDRDGLGHQDRPHRAVDLRERAVGVGEHRRHRHACPPPTPSPASRRRYSSLDGAPPQTGTTVSIASEGVHTLEYWSVDNAGQRGGALDDHDPHRQDRADDLAHAVAGAERQRLEQDDVTVTFDCADQSTLSGIASCTAPQTVATEGQGQPVTGVALDNAGNTASDTATLNIDKTPPTITGAPDRAANAAGWYRDDVTVTFTCGDALSGIDQLHEPGDARSGRATSRSRARAVDAAGNSASTRRSIHLEHRQDRADDHGCADDGAERERLVLGRRDDPLDVQRRALGDRRRVPGQQRDHRRRVARCRPRRRFPTWPATSSSATVDHIKIDRTAPVTSSDAPVGWRNADFTVHFTRIRQPRRASRRRTRRSTAARRQRRFGGDDLGPGHAHDRVLERATPPATSRRITPRSCSSTRRSRRSPARRPRRRTPRAGTARR